jgi:crossover junction endodeoxyribonuclease RusA
VSAIELRILGVPAPQGSKRHVGGGRMVESSKKVGPWRDAVAIAGHAAMGRDDPLDGPLRLTVEFRVPMPQSRKKADRERGWKWADRTPDLDKLLRSTLDGLTAGGVIVDDARVVVIDARMVEAVGWTGCDLTVRRVDQ